MTLSSMATKKHVFTPLEKKTFLDILKKYSKIIENRDSNSSSLRVKNMAWENVAREYNASPRVTKEVTTKQLRRLWMNLKQRQREAMSRGIHRHLADGPSTSTEIQNGVKQEIDSVCIESIDEEIDLDTTSESSDMKLKFDLTNMDESKDSQSQSMISSWSHKDSFLEKEYMDRLRRSNELHLLEKELLRQKIREAMAKAALAELLLSQQQSLLVETVIRNHEDSE